METIVKGKWFDKSIIQFEDVKDIKTAKRDFQVILGNPYSIKGKNTYCEKQTTLLTDLNESEESIWMGFRSNYRNEIRKAAKESVTVIRMHREEGFGDYSAIDRFMSMYEQMFKEKGIERVVDPIVMNAYIKGGNFVLTSAMGEEGYLVFHSYITDWKTAKLWHSCSEFREAKDSSYRNFIGRVNKYLHWTDIQFFKEKKLEVLDWGGISAKGDLKGITDFKVGFGGHMKEYYNIEVANTIKAKLYRKVKGRKYLCT